jgi:predicted nucleotidyltransferase
MNLSSLERKQISDIVKRTMGQKPYRIFVFGSRVSGRVQKSSDLDLLIKMENPLELSLLAMLKENFENSDLPFRVDAVDFHRLHKEYQSFILQEAVEIG